MLWRPSWKCGDNLLIGDEDVRDHSLLGAESPDVFVEWLIRLLLDFIEVEIGS